MSVFARVEGERSGDGFRFTAQRYDLEQAKYVPMWKAFGKESSDTRYLRRRYEDSRKDFLRIDGSYLEPLADVRQRVACNQASIDSAKKRWQQLRPRIEQLKAGGHLITISGALENGEVGVHWHYYYHELGTPARTIEDYSILSQLSDFPYVHEVNVGGMTNPEDLRYMQELKHIGLLRIYDLDGRGISMLKQGPRIDYLWAPRASAQGMAEIVQLDSIRTLDIGFNHQVAGIVKPDVLKMLSRLPQLEELSVHSGLSRRRRCARPPARGANLEEFGVW